MSQSQSQCAEKMCRIKKFAMEKKMMVLAKIREHKDILFGVFSDTLTKQLKSDRWKEVYDVARSINIVSANKDWTYVRDTFWQNCRKYTFIKIENSKKEGGKKCQLTQCDKIVLDIVGRESKLIVGIKLEEPPEEYVAPSEFLENLAASASTSMPSVADVYPTISRSFQDRVKKAKNRSHGQLSLLSLKKKKLMVKRIELLNHKTMLEIALLEKQLGIPCSNYTVKVIDEPHISNEDHNQFEHTEFSSSIKEENHVLNFDDH